MTDDVRRGDVSAEDPPEPGPAGGPSTGSAATTVAPGSRAAAKDRAARRRRHSFWRELPVLGVIALALALLVKAFAFQAFYIPSGSMENTLQVRDRVLVNKIVYRTRDVRRGEVVVFRAPDSWSGEVTVEQPGNPVARALRWVTGTIGLGQPAERDFIKRVVAVGGDTVQCCDDKGRVQVNGVALDEPYIFDDAPLESRRFGPVTVPKGRMFVLGDHRGASADSHYHLSDGNQGTVDVDRIVGRAFVIVWPMGHAGRLRVPDTFDRVRSSSLREPGAAASGGAPLAAALLLPVPAALRPRSRRTPSQGHRGQGHRGQGHRGQRRRHRSG